MNLLHTIGLMTRAEHERIVDEIREEVICRECESDHWQDKFKRAATDLAAQAEEIAALKKEIADFVRDANYDNDTIEGMRSEINALRPDAEAMRKKLAADRKRMAVKRGKGQ